MSLTVWFHSKEGVIVPCPPGYRLHIHRINLTFAETYDAPVWLGGEGDKGLTCFYPKTVCGPYDMLIDDTVHGDLKLYTGQSAEPPFMTGCVTYTLVTLSLQQGT